MAPNRTGVNDTKETVQWMNNQSFDREFNVNVVELLGYDPLTKNAAGEIVGGLKRVSTKSFGEYVANDIEETGNLTYIGFENLDGDYFIQKIDATTGKTIRFATLLNNSTITSYADAWTGRAALQYDTFSTAFTA
jgi:hypothetical protein